jgi:hypothetical protein
MLSQGHCQRDMYVDKKFIKIIVMNCFFFSRKCDVSLNRENDNLNLDAAVVVIVWHLDLKLPMQALPITSKVVSSNPTHGEVYSIQHYVIDHVCQ